MGAAGRFDHQALDDVIHARIRLAVMSILASVDDAEFTFLRDEVGTTDGNLTIHLKKLKLAGYVDEARREGAGRPTTAYALTDAGRDAFADYVDRLDRLIRRRKR